MKLLFELGRDNRKMDLIPPCEVETVQYDESLLRQDKLNLPQVSEVDLSRHYTELAKQAHMSMSNYVTACCLGQQIIIIEGLKEVLKELKAIGNNINQLVTLAHMGKVTVINLSEVRQLLADIRTAVREIAERKRW